MEGRFRQYTKNLSTSSGLIDTTELDRSSEIQVTKLYSQTLAYQARVVCQLPRNALVRYGRGILKVNDWSTMLAEIKVAESNCSAISDVVNAENVEAAWEERLYR